MDSPFDDDILRLTLYRQTATDSYWGALILVWKGII